LKNAPLKGRGIVVTRPASLANGLARLIESAGGRALLFPAIEIQPLAVRLPEGKFDMAVFISPTAVREGLPHLAHRPAHIVALSHGTRRELERQGISGAIAADEGAWLVARVKARDKLEEPRDSQIEAAGAQRCDADLPAAFETEQHR